MSEHKFLLFMLIVFIKKAMLLTSREESLIGLTTGKCVIEYVFRYHNQHKETLMKVTQPDRDHASSTVLDDSL